jgi:hypothetical protein
MRGWHIFEILRACGRSTRGGVAILVALALPAMLGIVGLGVETAVWYETKRRAQTAADAAAIAGALSLARGEIERIVASARAAAGQNGFVTSGVTNVAVHAPPTSGSYAGSADAVEVVVQSSFDPILAKLFIPGSLAIRARAVAEVSTLGNACVVALATTGARAIYVAAGASLDGNGCVLVANSNAMDAVEIAEMGSLLAGSVWTAGGFKSAGEASEVTLSDRVRPASWTMDDPHESLQVDSVPGCKNGFETATSINSAQSLTAGGGAFCGGLTLQAGANVTLAPGTYYIDGGTLQVNGGARLACNCGLSTEGVTFVLTNSADPASPATMRINQGADVALQAPASEGVQYSGMLVYQDPRATQSGTNALVGGSSMVLRGTLYFPKQSVEFSGRTSSGAGPCLRIVAQTITFTGISTIDDGGCGDAGVAPVAVRKVRLRE